MHTKEQEFLCKLVDSKHNRFLLCAFSLYVCAALTAIACLESNVAWARALSLSLSHTRTLHCIEAHRAKALAQQAKQRTLLRITQFIYIQLCYFTLLINAYAKAVVSRSVLWTALLNVRKYIYFFYSFRSFSLTHKSNGVWSVSFLFIRSRTQLIHSVSRCLF